MQRFARLLLVGLAATSLSPSAHGQAEAEPFRPPATNPPAVVQQRVAATDLEIQYNRPRVKGREIFGALVPFDRVWRTGSDSATKISFSTPISFGGQPLDAGSYELFTIPGSDEWTVIVAGDRSQWGSYSYDPTHDVLRVTARPTRLSEPVESFTLSVDDVRNATAVLAITWDRTRVEVPLAIDLRATVVPKLEEALRGEGRKPYFQAAMFYFETGIDLERAAELIAKALEGSPGHIGMLHRQALILEAKGDVQGAITAAESSLEKAQTAGDELRQEYTRLNTALLERLRR